MAVNLNNPVVVTSDRERGREVGREFIPADGNRSKFYQAGSVEEAKRLILQDIHFCGVNREAGTFIEVMLQFEHKVDDWVTICRIRLVGESSDHVSINFSGEVSSYKSIGDTGLLRFQKEDGDSTDYTFNAFVVGREVSKLE